MQCLDNFASYEADAARKHFEELMKKAVEENGRRRVELLLDAYKPGEGNDLSYDHFTEVRNALMSIYPKIDNHSDKNVQQITIDEWEMESKIFSDLVTKRLGDRPKEIPKGALELTAIDVGTEKSELIATQNV